MRVMYERRMPPPSSATFITTSCELFTKTRKQGIALPLVIQNFNLPPLIPHLCV